MAGVRGFEPRLADPETAVLPLDDTPIGWLSRNAGLKRFVGFCRLVLYLCGERPLRERLVVYRIHVVLTRAVLQSPQGRLVFGYREDHR